ncbi:type II toxin-antitoxin system PemK/MazF family toxin [Undibacterium sp. TC4M20W]|uniref:type II toxin-antitoxin system PemK/MazF family toxin n=1 Tax=Undibacterium sp. TC4M20W TaxID=3413052 RepID=UPI003BF44175
MALQFQPKVGDVLMCDFDGFVEPEMVKKRPVVIIARNKFNSKLVTIVPLSTTEPETLESHHYPLPINPVPAQRSRKCWAKCDMISTISIDRLDRLKDGYTRVIPKLNQKDIQEIRLCVMHALQLQNTVISSQLAATQNPAATTEDVAAGSAKQ